jgi:hypothetical protein
MTIPNDRDDDKQRCQMFESVSFSDLFNWNWPQEKWIEGHAEMGWAGVCGF